MRYRIKWVDAARGYAVLLVILGHLNIPGIRNYVYTFHLPVFFFISGYLFERKSCFKLFLLKKIKKIIIPYFSLSGIIILLDAVYNFLFLMKVNIWKGIESEIWAFLIQKRTSTLWFLACLFWVNIIFYILLKICHSIEATGLGVMILLLLGLDYYQYIGTILPWNLDVCVMALPFFYGGYVFRGSPKFQSVLLQKGKRGLFLILFALLNVIFGTLSRNIAGAGLEMYACSYGIVSFTYIAALSGIFCIVILSGLHTINLVQYIGRYSLVFFSLHQAVVMPYLEQIYKKLGVFQNTMGNDFERYMCAYVTLVCICIILTIFNEILRQTRWCFIIGQPYEKRHRKEKHELLSPEPEIDHIKRFKKNQD